MKTHLGHYDIVSELGRGGMGVVYKGFEGSLNRYVAIKVLADSLAHDEGIKERFLREARSMAALNDPHIIQIYFIGDDDGQTYFVMEFVEGESLGSMLKREHKLGVEQAAKVIHQTALGLATAHDRGVVHRDIKPGNLMITNRGAVKIADFGIALSNHDLSKKLTTTGEFVGTPGYLSPEVCLGKPVDQRSDIFSLGIVLFEMLTGKMPFNDESPLGLMLEVVKADIPDVRQLNTDVDAQIAAILARMIAKDPADRYQSCHELVADLNAYTPVAKGGPITAQTKMSSAAATLIGQKTPVSGQSTLPRTPPTPLSMRNSGAGTHVTTSGLPQPPPALGISGAPASATPAVAERATAVPVATPRRSALPWAIAALVLLGIGGGAYAYRGHIPALAGLLGAPATLADTAGSTHTTAAAPTAANVAEVAASVAANAPANAAPAAPPPAPVDSVATPPANATPGATDSQAMQARADATTNTATDSAGAPAARASQEGMQALHELPAAQAATDAAAAAPQMAKVTPPQRPAAPPKPHVPTVAVVVAGDDVISAPAEEAVINALQSRGFRVIEGGHTHGSSPNLGALAGRADAVVFVNARPVGSQEIQYYGQSSTLYTVQLGIKVYRVADRSVLWSGNTQQVNFTSLNAAQKAREAIGPMLENVGSRLGEFRAHGRRG